ncbi:MAG: alpha/beta hydrolase [Pseudomonadota bacterium]
MPTLYGAKAFGAALSLVLMTACATVATADDSTHSPEYSWTKYSYEPYPFPYYVEDTSRYPEGQAPQEAVNRHGEVEYIGDGVFGAHWFVDVEGATWHFVTAGDPSKEPVLFIHGYPDTWYAYHKVMADLADDFYVIAVDTLGYGQSDKGAEIDVSYAAVAGSLVKLLGRIGIDDFNLIAHDRGSVISDHLIATDGISDRINAFLRMQQSFDQPHGLPRPPHAQMATPQFHSAENMIRNMYAGNYVSVHMPEDELARLEWEWGFEGTAEASARTFQGTSFDKELEFRMANTFPKMTMPVLILQGTRDPGQHAEEYFQSADVIPNGRVVLVDTNHFIHTEDPKLVATLARDLFTYKNRNRPDKVSTYPVDFLYPVKE